MNLTQLSLDTNEASVAAIKTQYCLTFIQRVTAAIRKALDAGQHGPLLAQLTLEQLGAFEDPTRALSLLRGLENAAENEAERARIREEIEALLAKDRKDRR